MGCMGGAGGEIHEKWLVWRERLLVAHPVDRLVGHVGHEVIVRILRQLHLRHSVKEQRRPLVGFAAEKAVKLVESGAGRPAVGRAGGTEFPGCGLMGLAEGCRAIAVQPQHLGQRRDIVGSAPGIAGERGRNLRDRAHVVHVMITAAQQRGTGRRAERRCMEMVVAQSVVGEALDRRHVNGTAERARLAESHVVDQHDEHVRGTGRRLDLEARRGCGLADVDLRDQRALGFRNRQHRPIELVCRLSRNRHSCHQR